MKIYVSYKQTSDASLLSINIKIIVLEKSSVKIREISAK